MLGIYTRHVSLLDCPFFALFQHVGVDIRADDARVPVGVDLFSVVEHPEGNVARATGDVEDAHGLAAGSSARVEGADKVVLPETVNAKGHGIVHDIIRGGDGGENLGDCLCLN